MKNILFVITFLFLSFFSFSQDTLVKNNGEKMIGKVIEISETRIKYTKENQLDGPLRSIEILSVRKIMYKDGIVEIFAEEKYVPKELLFRSGFYIDFSFGYSQKKSRESYYLFYAPSYPFNQINRTDFFSTNIKLGNKWYFGKREHWRPGIQVQWIRISLNFNSDFHTFLEDLVIGDKNFSIGNVGMANIFKISEKMGLEVNFITGLNLNGNIDNDYLTPGLAISPEIKLRLNKFALGIDYQYIQSFKNFHDSQWNSLNLSVGFKL